MKETIMIITASILISSAITILGIQDVSAGSVNTTRSNIKSSRTHASGDDSQATSQDTDTEIITSIDNTCSSESDCSNTISISTGDNSNDGSKQPPDS